MSWTLKVMLVAAEASADALGAGLARALKAKMGAQAVTFVGVGGAQMAAEGVASPFDIADLSLVGLFEIAGAVPRTLARLEETVRLAEAEHPDVVVLIDSWGFMWRVARRLKLRAPGALRIKYVAPQVWAWGPGRARTVAKLFDRLMTLFAFEVPYFEAEGIAAACVGNPTLSRDFSRADPARLRSAFGVAPDAPILLVLPGSRPGEIKRILPVFEDAAIRLTNDRPDLQIVIPAAPTVAAAVKARVARWPFRAHLVEGEPDKLAAMRAATLALACSGTVTTELAVAGCPMLVGYRGHPATALVVRMVLRTRFFTLLNLAADQEIAPEFLQERCNGREIAAAAAALLDDPSRRQAQAEAQRAALTKLGLGVADPFAAAADAVIDAARERGLIPA
ncbi:MAG: lipid-A-disaccharide synthase [Caulobacterales bacterium]